MAKIPFDIKYRDKIESGEYRVETFLGYPVTIYRWDFDDGGQTPIIGSYVFEGSTEHLGAWGEDGHFDLMSPNNLDLFIITPEPELSELEERIFKLLRQYKECDIPLTPENIKAEASMLWPDLEKYFFDLYGKEGEGDSALRSFYHRGFEDGEAEALRTRATELTKDLAKSGLDKDSIPYHLIEFMCNLYTCQNWKEIEETAEAYATRIKAAALKDLPRWGSNLKSSMVDKADVIGLWLYYKEHRIRISDLEKLPGFNE